MQACAPLHSVHWQVSWDSYLFRWRWTKSYLLQSAGKWCHEKSPMWWSGFEIYRHQYHTKDCMFFDTKNEYCITKTNWLIGLKPKRALALTTCPCMKQSYRCAYFSFVWVPSTTYYFLFFFLFFFWGGGGWHVYPQPKFLICGCIITTDARSRTIGFMHRNTPCTC